MEKTILKPVIDQVKTGDKIKQLRKTSGFTVKQLQDIFGFEYPQAIYSWESGKNIPTIDNLFVLSQLFCVTIEELVVTKMVEVVVENECFKKTA